jgi:hypothetical protein
VRSLANPLLSPGLPTPPVVVVVSNTTFNFKPIQEEETKETSNADSILPEIKPKAKPFDSKNGLHSGPSRTHDQRATMDSIGGYENETMEEGICINVASEKKRAMDSNGGHEHETAEKETNIPMIVMREKRVMVTPLGEKISMVFLLFTVLLCCLDVGGVPPYTQFDPA